MSVIGRLGAGSPRSTKDRSHDGHEGGMILSHPGRHWRETVGVFLYMENRRNGVADAGRCGQH